MKTIKDTKWNMRALSPPPSSPPPPIVEATECKLKNHDRNIVNNSPAEMTRRLSTQFTLCGTFLTPPLVPRSQRRVKQLITQPSQLTGAGPFSLLVPSLIKRRLCFSTIGTLHYLFVVILHFFFLFMPLLFYSPTQPPSHGQTDVTSSIVCRAPLCSA